MRLLWVIPGYYGLFRVIMGFCRTAWHAHKAMNYIMYDNRPCQVTPVAR